MHGRCSGSRAPEQSASTVFDSQACEMEMPGSKKSKNTNTKIACFPCTVYNESNCFLIFLFLGAVKLGLVSGFEAGSGPGGWKTRAQAVEFFLWKNIGNERKLINSV